MLIIGILCLFVAAISYFRYLSEKQNNANKNSTNEAKWQRTLAIIFLILGVILVVYAVALHRF